MINEKKLISDFEKNGFIIENVNKKIIDKLRSDVVKTICKKIKYKPNGLYKSDDFFLNNFHKLINKKQLNEVRFSIYNLLNSNQKFSEIYYTLVKNFLDILVGNELAMQKKINLSIQIPKDKNSLLDMHSDIYAGESPFQVVVWLPLVDVYKTKAMFFTKPNYSKKMNNEILYKNKNTIKQIYNKNKNKFKFLKVKYGEVVIFSPIILHGNTVNNTKETRFSFNCRFKSLLSPYDVILKSHRNIPNFYRPLNIKPLTKVGFNYLNKFSD